MQFIYKYKRIVLIIKLIVMWVVYKLQPIDYQLFTPPFVESPSIYLILSSLHTLSASSG